MLVARPLAKAQRVEKEAELPTEPTTWDQWFDEPSATENFPSDRDQQDLNTALHPASLALTKFVTGVDNPAICHTTTDDTYNNNVYQGSFR
jgi:hypothetical protein